MSESIFDVLLVFALEEELQALYRFADYKRDLSSNNHLIIEVRNPDHDVSFLAVLQNDMGKEAAANAVEAVLEEHLVRLIATVGIAGGLSKDLQLGDVAYTGAVIDLIENQKIKDDTEGGTKIAFSPNHYETPSSLTWALNMTRVHPENAKLYQKWQSICDKYVEELRIEHHSEKAFEQITSKPKSQHGSLATGSVSQSARYKNQVLEIDRKVLAIDMEGAGVFQRAKKSRIPAINIRGVCDYADPNKTDLEFATKEIPRRVAAHNALAFLFVQFDNPSFQTFMRSSIIATGSVLPLEDPSESRSPKQTKLSHLVSKLEEHIEEHLKELSPEYRIKTKGYRMPVPRLRRTEVSEDFRADPKSRLREIEQAIAEHDLVVIDMPVSYPDHSLPWVMAKKLQTELVGETTPFPIVISGQNVKPPKGTIASAVAADGFGEALDFENLTPVFIISEPKLFHRNRVKFLESEIQKYPDSKFVILTRGERDNLLRDSFVQRLGGYIFDLSEISFLTMSHFLEKNFEMDVREAEFVALRLRETFIDFDLSAHPSYLAGISQETIFALLRANKRSELIQLAVDGFLSFVVAEDKGDVNLSRTTRAQFLETLAIEKNINKRNFTYEDLITFTKNIAERMDYDISARSFVGAFIDKGILHMENGLVEFSLPFIESYLLANGLKKNEKESRQYFDIENADFDLTTFDLYSEMGPDPKIVKRIQEAISYDAAKIKSYRQSPEILLTDGVRPRVLQNYDRIRSLNENLNDVIDRIKGAQDEREEKQALLDVADEITEAAGRQSASKSGVLEETEGERQSELVEQVDPDKDVSKEQRHWVIADTLLGSAAEHLDGETKRDISKSLLSVGVTVIDVWLRDRKDVDFEHIREKVWASDRTQRFLDQVSEEMDRDAAERLLDHIYDMLEFSFVAEPFRRIVEHLCE